MTLGSHQRCVGKSQNHITPKFIIDALGPFALDPCASVVRPWDCARINLTIAQNGLYCSWHPSHSVFLNPPFDRYQVAKWIQKLADHGNGIALVHARTETDWFEPIWAHASALLFLADRLIFCKPDGSPCTVRNKQTGKAQPANSGAPVVLAAFGAEMSRRLENCGLHGFLVTEWIRR